MVTEAGAQVGSPPKPLNGAALAPPPIVSDAAIAPKPRAARSDLRVQRLRYQAAFDNIAQGVCFFDGRQRLILCNRRFAEIYRLSPACVRKGMTLRELTEHGVAVGISPVSVEETLAFHKSITARAEPRVWILQLNDGRRIRISYQPRTGGGWASVHEDVTEFIRNRTFVNEGVTLQALIDLLPDYLWVKDRESRFVVVNKALASDSGRKKTSDLIGLNDFDLHEPELAQQFRRLEENILRTGNPMIEREESIAVASGARKWTLSTKLPLRNKENEIIGLVGVSRDITERRQADRLRDGQAQILEMIAMSAPLETVLDRLVRLVESQLTGLFGSILLLDADGLHLRHGAAPSLAEAYAKAVDGIAIGPKAGSCGSAAYRREPVVVADVMQSPLWEGARDLAATHGYRSCWSTPIMSHQRQVLGCFALYSGSVREPTEAETRLIFIATRIAGIAIERKLAEERILFMATHDALTGLPNRSLLDDRISQAILYAQRYDRGVVVMFVDLDNFKVINDSLGHNAGDELLKQTARRMVACLRETDTVMRLGGDEFVIVLFDQPKSAEHVPALLQKLRAAIAEPLQIEGHTLRVTGSIGVASYPNDAKEVATLLANADAAMYRAKQIGRDNFQFFTPDLNRKAQGKLLLQEELRNAVTRHEFVLFYQPQADLRTGSIFAVEALIRWMHPRLGSIAPAAFIPLAEETGLIVPIGDWVLREACRQNKAWQDAGLPHMNIGVNVSARQFKEKNLVAKVVDALQESGLQAKYLELEVTESLIMQDVEAAVATMKELQSLGVQISIDDFGTGYSSLSALRTFPVARLKIDKSFIAELTANEQDRILASAVISLAQKLKLRVIAEGVETDEQLALLRQYDCDEMQGYRLSKPLAAAELERLVRGHSPHDQR